MKEGWKKVRLGDVCLKIGSGATPRGGQESYKPHGTSLIRSQNVLDFTFSKHGLAFIDEKQANELSNVEVVEHDILLNITGDSVARVCQVPKNILPARVNQHVAIIRPSSKIINSTFLKYYLLNKEVKAVLLGLSSSGATRNALTKAMIENLELTLPPLEEQRRIASILTALDDKIELNRRMNETLEGIAGALWEEWFGKYVRDGEELPEGWRWGKVGDMYKTTSGGTPSRAKAEYYIGGTINWVKSKELKDFFVIETEEKITEHALKNSSAKLLPKHSVLVAMYGATVGDISILSHDAACNQAICAILPNTRYSYCYIFQFLTHESDKIKNLAVGAAQQNISQDLILKLDIPIPTDVTIKEYEKTAEPLFENILHNINQNYSLTHLRDTLLERLMKEHHH